MTVIDNDMIGSRCVAIVLASGAGQRFGGDLPKQFLKLAGKTVLEHTLDIFERHQSIDEIVLVCREEDKLFVEELVNGTGYRKIHKIVRGGMTRRESSASGVAVLQGDNQKVLIHDAARPLLDGATITRCVKALDVCDAVDTAIPSGDTIVQLDESDGIEHVPDRSRLRLGQTPQGFRLHILRRAHDMAKHDKNIKVTDDCGLVLQYGLSKVAVVAGDVSNIKITYPSDIYLADRLFQLRSRQLVDHEFQASAVKGKTIVVFGASRGIGHAVCELADQAGAQVVGVSRGQGGVNVVDPEAVRATLINVRKKFGVVDAVILTAGVLRAGLLANQDYAEVDDQIDINLRGSVVVAKEAFEAMKELGGSIALFTSSSYTRGRARSSIYSATKAAVVNLMQGLSDEFRPFGVRVNAINPERTATPMRTGNFGIEPPETLLDATVVARATLAACMSDATGEVIDVRR